VARRRHGPNRLAAARTVKALRQRDAIDDTDHALVALVLSSAEALDRELERAAERAAKTYTVAPAQRVHLAALVELDRRARAVLDLGPTLDEVLASAMLAEEEA